MAEHEHEYKILYRLEYKPEGVKKEDVPKDMGATDALFMASIIYPPDGSLSVLFMSRDGRTGDDLEDIEWFKVFILLASRLGKSKTLHESKRSFCEAVFTTVQEALMDSKEGTA